MTNKVETIGIGVSIVFMILALYLLRTDVFSTTADNQASAGMVVVGNGENINQERREALTGAVDKNGVNKIVMEDVKIGEGAEVKSGDMVVVHYVGTLPDSTEFDNSRRRGQPFTFQVGAGSVIKGWDEGLVGMKVGGQRILVIPPDKGYGAQAVGPIPANSTLVFAIELLEIR